MKGIPSWSRINLSSFQRIGLATNQQKTRQYLNQWCPRLLMHIRFTKSLWISGQIWKCLGEHHFVGGVIFNALYVLEIFMSPYGFVSWNDLFFGNLLLSIEGGSFLRLTDLREKFIFDPLVRMLCNAANYSLLDGTKRWHNGILITHKVKQRWIWHSIILTDLFHIYRCCLAILACVCFGRGWGWGMKYIFIKDW